MRHRRLFLALAVVAVLVVAWLALEPGDRFGHSTSALTTWDRVPLPYVDLQVRGDGTFRVVPKTHRVTAGTLAWLAEPAPDVVIFARGWEGHDARFAGLPPALRSTRILELPTGEALSTFNVLRRQGLRVAIHVHSTC